jgi:hypothetical protein
MKKILLLLFFLTTIACFGQVDDAGMGNDKEGDPLVTDITPQDTDEPFNFAVLPVKPEFPGGLKALYKKFNDSINIANLTNTVEGQDLKVIINFIVERDGSVTNVKLLRDPGFGFGKEALRAFSSIQTKWKPGQTTREKVVRTSYTLPFTYSVPDPEGRETSISLVKEPEHETTGRRMEEPLDYKTIQVKPEFPGGLQNFYNYVSRHIDFNKIDASAKGQKLTATISFIVEKDGSMSNFNVTEDPGFGSGKEVIRVLQNMKTKWNPGIQNGKPVRATFRFPIVISVPE